MGKLFLIFFTWFGFFACSSAQPPISDPPDNEPNLAPRLLELNIEEGQILSIDAKISATFSEPLSMESLTRDHFSLTRTDGSPVNGTFQSDGSRVTFRPHPALDFNASYLLSLGTGLRDDEGAVLENPATLTFTTEIFSSALPIFIIDTAGETIIDDPKIPAKLRIIYQEGESSMLSDPVFFSSDIGIEIRGHTSQHFPKKQYGFETWDALGEDENVELLGLPQESDWILQGSYIDRSFLRNYLPYELSRELGRYASRVRFVELFLNQRGDNDSSREYLGLHLLLEKVKRDGERVDIAKLDPEDNAEPDISGGYILAIDRASPEDLEVVTSNGTRLLCIYPDPEDLSAEQYQWIRNYLNQFEAALAAEDFSDPITGYAAYLDVDAFVDYFLINEVMRNVDAFRFSTFVHKDRGGKLVMGPVWDFDRSMGNHNLDFLAAPQGWQSIHEVWINRLRQDPNFVARVVTRYFELRETIFSEEYLLGKIAEGRELIGSAEERNFQRWQILDIAGDPFRVEMPGTYEAEVEFVQTWLQARLEWLDVNIEQF